MPNYRLIHANYRTGRKSKQLTELELIVWLAYLQSADDFGVCPASARKLQGDDPWLDRRPTKMVQRCIDRLITVGLVRTFSEDGDVYLYQPDWQDYQKIKYPSTTSYPSVPEEEWPHCSEKTRELFSKRLREDFGNIREALLDLPTANANPNAKANANALKEAFDRFWACYPNKTGKEAARKAWAKIKPDAELTERMLAALEWQRQQPQWLQDGGKFIPHPTTWLNQGRWQDEPQDIPQLSAQTTQSLKAIYGTN